MATSAKLETLRSRLRRGQLIVGLGFGALLVGSVVTAALMLRLGPRLAGAPTWVLAPIELVLRNLWCLAVLPLVAWAVARAVPLRPWSTAAGTVAAGELFLRMLLFVQGGADALWPSALDFVRWLLIAALSVFLVRTAVARGRAQAEALQARVQRQAEARAGEYQAFARDAQRLAERTEARQRPEGGATAEPGTVAEADAAATRSDPPDVTHQDTAAGGRA